jgi:molybdopterin molybdotransferase
VSLASQSRQRITQLIPLTDVLERIDALVRAVEPSSVEHAAAAGCVLAADVVAGAPVPTVPSALLDGWAVNSERVADASDNAPVPLHEAPSWVELGSAVANIADAIVAPDAVIGGEVFVAPTAGDGVMPVGGEVGPGELLRRTGERIRGIDIALLCASGVTQVHVRVPSVKIVTATQHIDLKTDTVGPLAARVVAAHGGVARLTRVAERDVYALEEELISQDADALIVIGGTGAGHRDRSIETLARIGRVEAHGIALAPGTTAAFGLLGTRPVLLVPGRLDGALAVLLTLGRHLIACLTGAGLAEPPRKLRIARKVSSTLGLAEVVLVRRKADELEPIARQFLSLRALARSDGWILVPAQSEGYPPGSIVEMLPLP